MRKPSMLVVGALALGLTGVASAHPSGHLAASQTISLRHTRLGTILVAPSGFTLYEFTRDRMNSDNCQHISRCTSFWPPLSTSGPRAGSGVSAHMLGTIRLQNGTRQVTYAGHPLYLYAGDTHPAETSYVGVNASGGVWYAVNAQGGAVR